MNEWAKNIISTVVAGILIAVLAGVFAFYGEVKANTQQNKIDAEFNIKIEAMFETLIRIDENVKALKSKTL